MFIHPSFLLFLIFLFLSILMVMSANSWFMAWIALEINLLSYIPMLLKKNNKYNAEAALKYFLTQTIASIMIITAIMIMNSQKELFLILLMTALLMKMSAAPSHQWLPSLVEGLSWPIIFMLLTIQKISPILLLSYIMKYMEMNHTGVIYFYVLMSALIGSIGGLSQTSLRKIMVFSSISHTAWILMSLFLSNYLWFIYFMIYFFILSTLIISFNLTQSFKLSDIMLKNKQSISILMALSIMSLGGLPPLSGFIPKFIVIQELIYQNTLILIILLLSTFLSLFFYSRMFLINLMYLSYMNTWKIVENKTNIFLSFINMVGLFIPSFMIIMILNFKLYKL